MKKFIAMMSLLVLLLPLLAACGSAEVATQVAEQAPTAVEQIEGALDSETPITALVPTAVQEVQQAATAVAPMPGATGEMEGEGTPGLGELPVQTPIGEVANPTEIMPTEGEIGTAEATIPSAATVYTKNKPPAVDNAAARQFEGQKITYYGDTVGIGRDLDQILAKQFTQQTGIQVEVVPKPESATDAFSTYQRFFQAKDAGVDVMMLDVIWPGAFAPHLVDLKPELGNLANMHYQGIIENNTVDGKLVAMPWFGDFGMLYYRTDLLEKYGYESPPKTWDELEQMAREVMEGEKANRQQFTGFVFQGAAYEGLTCNALEWLASAGGGDIVTPEGEITVNNPEAIQMLRRAQGWVGTISPRGVTTYQEEDARNVFQSGNALFMRNWPYAYAAGQADGSAIKGRFNVAPLPTNPNQEPVGTVGGWQLGVSEYSDAKEASIEFVRYMTGPEVQTYRAVVGAYVPTIPQVTERPAVVEAMPFLQPMESVRRVTRPAGVLGDDYNEGSTAVFQGVNQVLSGADPDQQMSQVAQRLQRLLRRR